MTGGGPEGSCIGVTNGMLLHYRSDGIAKPGFPCLCPQGTASKEEVVSRSTSTGSHVLEEKMSSQLVKVALVYSDMGISLALV